MEMSDQRQVPAALLPGMNPGTHLRRGCLNPKDGRYYTKNGKNLLHVSGHEPRIVHPSAKSLY
jgi:hypothetical protein